MLDCARVAARGGALRHSFERLDRDGDGYISVQDLVMVRSLCSVTCDVICVTILKYNSGGILCIFSCTPYPLP
jgi:hypothetical protein